MQLNSIVRKYGLNFSQVLFVLCICFAPQILRCAEAKHLRWQAVGWKAQKAWEDVHHQISLNVIVHPQPTSLLFVGLLISFGCHSYKA